MNAEQIKKHEDHLAESDIRAFYTVSRAGYEALISTAKEVETLRVQLAEAQAENKRLALKAASSLANNLCPDHRDKQAGRPCLACEIERMLPPTQAIRNYEAKEKP